MISIDSREVDNDGGSDRDRDEDTDDEESMGTYPDTGRGRRYPSISDFPIASLSLVSRSLVLEILSRGGVSRITP